MALFGHCEHLADRRGWRSIELVIGKYDIQLGRSQQETGSDRVYVAGQPEAVDIHIVLADTRSSHQDGKTRRKLPFDAHNAVSLGVDPRFPFDQVSLFHPGRQLENVAVASA